MDEEQITGRFILRNGVLLLKSDDGEEIDGFRFALPNIGILKGGMNVVSGEIMCEPVDEVMDYPPDDLDGFEAVVAIIPRMVAKAV